jgi:glycosyltransferase involved in cell wall biosynthesis
VYSQQILFGLARSHQTDRFDYYYRPNRFLRSWAYRIPSNAHRRLLGNECPYGVDLFHGLNQRLPARASGVPMACTFHDLFVMTGDYSSQEFRQRFAGQARLAAERADRIIAVSHFTATQVNELLGVEWERIRVIPHGVLLPNVPISMPRENIVLHVGAIQVRKNILRLIDAFEMMPLDWDLVLAGSKGYGADQILARIETSHARDRIHATGYVSATQLEDLYAKASIFAFPSLDEGFGMPVLDAMARGVPVITSNRSALPEVAGDAALLVDPLDVADIAGALHRLVSEPDLRRQMVAAGLAHSRQFSWADSVDRTWRVYLELVDQ